MNDNTCRMYPITKMYQVFLSCSNCHDYNMIRDSLQSTFDGKDVIYQYKCPMCGHKTTSKLCYPFQRAEFDFENPVSINENEIDL